MLPLLLLPLFSSIYSWGIKCSSCLCHALTLIYSMWVTTTWAKKPHCPVSIPRMPKQAVNKHEWVDTNHWVIGPQTHSPGNNVHWSIKKMPFVRRNSGLIVFPKKGYFMLIALVIKWKTCGNETVTAEETSLISSSCWSPHSPCLYAPCSLKGNKRICRTRVITWGEKWGAILRFLSRSV